MPEIYWWISATFLLLLVVVVLAERRAFKLLVGLALGLIAVAVTKNLALSGNLVEVKGHGAGLPWGLIGLLYLALIAGMAAQYAFLKSPRARFRWPAFLKPFLASPVVFLPLLGSLEDQLDGGPWTLSRLMLVFVAFQNGFFWKTFFDAQAGKLQVKD
jgi:hypothetical protein